MQAGEGVAAAYLQSCLAELEALKPGNVHVHASGHGMTVADYVASARASASAIGDPALSVGQRIFEAIRRTREAVGCNTNLGIVLLCAPLAQGAMMRGGPLRARLKSALDRLTIEDAEQAFAAIRLAQPGGLGSSERHDVNRPATVTLREAMAAASDRDRIAAQYATDFDDLFAVGLPALQDGMQRWNDVSWATSETFLAFLSRYPDSHIARKFGDRRAEQVRDAARQMVVQLRTMSSRDRAREALLRFDTKLKCESLNPGTSADMTVATLFVNNLLTSERESAC